MKKVSGLIYSLFTSAVMFCSINICAQDSIVTDIVKRNVSLFAPDNNAFTGIGWANLIAKAKECNNVLIGEDHFTNEIPYFTSALASQIKFDNFFCEIDPFTASIVQEKIKSLREKELQEYVHKYGNTFSFYAFAPEFTLLKQLTESNVKILGTDQILLVGDRILCSELQKITKNKKAKEIYLTIENNSKIHFENFLKDQTKPFYLLTDDFSKRLESLELLQLSPYEIKIIDALKLSAAIYKSQSHHLRIQLMKNQLMEQYTGWAGKKNLFKYGANHVAKGESLMEIYDIGNLVYNIDDSGYKKSLHIMILGSSGTQASPFEGYPEEKIDENNNILKTLRPITSIVNGNQWHCFNMLPLRKALSEGKVIIEDVMLSRIVKGYDMVIIIPKVTASKITSGSELSH